MTRRDDLEELHALAASIAEESDGWRARRRQRAASVEVARTEAQLTAPVRRRRRHRVLAGVAVGLVAAGAGTAIALHRPAKPAPAKHHAALAVDAPVGARLGRQAALTLGQQGRIPDLFACEGLLSQQDVPPANQSATFRSDYLTACVDGTGSGAEERSNRGK